VFAVLFLAALYGLLRDRNPATLNNVGFLVLHMCVLGHGVATAIMPSLTFPAAVDEPRVDELAA